MNTEATCKKGQHALYFITDRSLGKLNLSYQIGDTGFQKSQWNRFQVSFIRCAFNSKI